MPKHASKHPKTSQHIPESLVLVASSFGVTRDHYGGGQAVVGSGASKPTFEEQIGFVFWFVLQKWGGAPPKPAGSPDRFGLLGLLSVIRMSDPDLTTLALGTDLTTLGLNLNLSASSTASTLGLDALNMDANINIEAETIAKGAKAKKG